MNGILLALSIALSAGRNLLSKKISSESFGTVGFFQLQAGTFGTGAAVLLLPALTVGGIPSLLTVLYALLYGLLLVGAQWCYTVALGGGNTAVCATVYSLGFILPTLSGMVFWNETVTLWKVFGIVAVFPALILSGKKQNRNATEGLGSTLPLIIAMLCSGGLGILQKVQQSSPYPQQRTTFVCIAFAAAAMLSLFCGIGKKSHKRAAPTFGMASAGVGACFALCNLLNTFLAGRMDSTVFFPGLNVGTILLSTVLGVLVFREKLSARHIAVLTLGTVSILLINLPL
ncbi:MAG: hypothetical protein IJC19_08200 [Clostridia bacterium]|nr:hypothetical protein [Clostridia bacterium]